MFKEKPGRRVDSIVAHDLKGAINLVLNAAMRAFPTKSIEGSTFDERIDPRTVDSLGEVFQAMYRVQKEITDLEDPHLSDDVEEVVEEVTKLLISLNRALSVHKIRTEFVESQSAREFGRFIVELAKRTREHLIGPVEHQIEDVAGGIKELIKSLTDPDHPLPDISSKLVISGNVPRGDRQIIYNEFVFLTQAIKKLFPNKHEKKYPGDIFHKKVEYKQPYALHIMDLKDLCRFSYSLESFARNGLNANYFLRTAIQIIHKILVYDRMFTGNNVYCGEERGMYWNREWASVKNGAFSLAEVIERNLKAELSSDTETLGILRREAEELLSRIAQGEKLLPS